MISLPNSDPNLSFSHLEPVKDFSSEAELEIFARECINKNVDDAEDLICSDTPTVNRADLRNADNGKQSKTNNFLVNLSFAFYQRLCIC